MKKSPSIKINIVFNVTKQCCRIIFPLITYPYISNILGSTNLGKYSFADSIIQYFMILATLGVTGYAVREGARIRDDKEAINQFAAEVFGINIVSLLFSLLGLFVCLIFSSKLNEYRTLLILLSLNIVFTVVGREWVNLIYEDISFITIRYILFQFLALIGMFAFVKNENNYIVYAAIMVFATSGAQIVNIFRTQKFVPIKLAFSYNTKKHIKPILFMFCISAATVVYVNSDITILGYLRTESEVGIYYMVSKIYTLCKTLLNAIITVITPRVAYYIGSKQEEKYADLLNMLRKGLITLLIPCIVGLFMMSENVICLISSDEFVSGAPALKILCIAMLFAVLGCYYSQGILIPNRCEKVFLIATLVSAVINIGLNFILIPILGINGAALTTVLAEIIVFVICFSYSRNFFKHSVDKVIIPVVIGAICISVVCYLVKSILRENLLSTVVAVVLSFIIYSFIQIIFKNECFVFILKNR